MPLVLRAVGGHRDPDEEAGLAEVEIGVAHQLHRQSARFVVLVESIAHHVSLGEHRVAIIVIITMLRFARAATTASSVASADAGAAQNTARADNATVQRVVHRTSMQ